MEAASGVSEELDGSSGHCEEEETEEGFTGTTSRKRKRHVKLPQQRKTYSSPSNDVKAHEVLDHFILRRVGAQPSSPNEVSSSVLGDIFPFGPAQPDATEVQILIDELPPQSYSDSLVRLYLDRVEWMHGPLHRPTFLESYKAFWGLPTASRASCTSPIWLALLFSILCLGLHFKDSPTSIADAAKEKQLYYASRKALSQANFLSSPNITAIQTIICLGIYLNNTDDSTAADMLLAVAIKMALFLGLSRIENECPKIGRQDAATTSKPANINDEDLSATKTCENFPRLVPTQSSYHIEKIEFAIITREYVDAINSSYPNPSYAEILRLDARYRSAYIQLPPFLRPDLPQPLEAQTSRVYSDLVWQRAFMGLTLHNRLMRIHRGFMAKRGSSLEYAFSTAACLESAEAYLDQVAEMRLFGFPGLKWWVVLVHIWTAGLVFLADLYQREAESGDRPYLNKQARVYQAIELLEPAAKSSPLAHRAIAILRALLESDDIRREQIREYRPVDSASAVPVSAVPTDQFPTTFWSTLFEADLTDLSSLPPLVDTNSPVDSPLNVL
ncbi:MAG: hypothetical protein CYPHOPRED_002400 [Cyphobasidiales sp. Tagirdzhanova-0007]|nr:MAG: hypothetical protein CYPHOPRED_002400 [Cyphobasidiales sp. Tagirdzhanova-0007]